MPTPPARLRVAICGGGIGGLTLALALASYTDIAINIYEAAMQFEELGAGLAIWGRAVAALKKLGLEEKLRSIAPGKNENTEFQLRKADMAPGGEVLGSLVLSSKLFSANLGFHRAQFINMLVDILSKTERVTTHFGKRCISFKEYVGDPSGGSAAGGLVTVHFADGTSTMCDVLIGCDGIKSAVRAKLMQPADEVRARDHDSRVNPKIITGTIFSGTVAYRALVKPGDLRMIAGEHSAISVRKMYCGKDKHIVTYPVAGGRFINLIAYSSDPARQSDWERGPWVVEVEQEEVLRVFHDFEPEVQALLKCINKPSRWAMYEVEPLSFWSKGRVTILGDAAHAMTPFIGAGGGQVIEDIYVLSRLLGSPISTCETLPAILRAYEETRRPRAKKVLMSTREARRALEYQEEYKGAEAFEVTEGLQRLVGWLWEGRGDPDDDVEAAEKLAEAFISRSVDA